MFQMVCGSALLVLGMAGIAYGVRALSGEARLPTSLFRLKTGLPAPPPKSQDIMLASALGLMVGAILLLGGIGLLVVSLL